MINNGNEERWFARQYVYNKKEEEVIFEHSLLKYIKSRDPSLVAIPIQNEEGNTYFKAFLKASSIFTLCLNFYQAIRTIILGYTTKFLKNFYKRRKSISAISFIILRVYSSKGNRALPKRYVCVYGNLVCLH